MASGILPDLEGILPSGPNRLAFAFAQEDLLPPPGGRPRLYGRRDVCRHRMRKARIRRRLLRFQRQPGLDGATGQELVRGQTTATFALHLKKAQRLGTAGHHDALLVRAQDRAGRAA